MIGFALIFTGIYSPLMLKTLRIYRIFEAGARASKVTYAGNKTQLSLALVIFVVHVRITSFILKHISGFKKNLLNVTNAYPKLQY